MFVGVIYGLKTHKLQQLKYTSRMISVNLSTKFAQLIIYEIFWCRFETKSKRNNLNSQLASHRSVDHQRFKRLVIVVLPSILINFSVLTFHTFQYNKNKLDLFKEFSR